MTGRGQEEVRKRSRRGQERKVRRQEEVRKRTVKDMKRT